MCGSDAVAYTRPDTHRQRPPWRRSSNSLKGDTEKALYALTGGKLQSHMDLGLDTPGTKIAAKMRNIHPAFPWLVQAQHLCHSVPKSGYTFVFVPGESLEPHQESHFYHISGRDFCACTKAGYDFFHGKWRCVDDVPRGCLILWLSNNPPHQQTCHLWDLRSGKDGCVQMLAVCALCELGIAMGGPKAEIGGGGDRCQYGPLAIVYPQVQTRVTLFQWQENLVCVVPPGMPFGVHPGDVGED